MKINKTDKEQLKSLEGNEIYFKDELVLIEFPFIISTGIKRELTLKEWKALLKGYWENDENEGYWLIQEVLK